MGNVGVNTFQSDADTLDGKHASDFYNANYGLRTNVRYSDTDVFSTELTYTHPCWNKWVTVQGDGTTGLDPEPHSVLWYEVLTGGIENRAFQIAIGCYTGQRKTFIRYKHDNVWSGWFNIADGGNANTLSGHSWTEIFKSNLWASSADCNDLTTPGWYSFNGCSGGHAPGTNSTVSSGTYFVMGVIPLSAIGYLVQIATFVHGSTNLIGKTYIRYCNNSEWSDWVNIADNGNAALFGNQIPEYYTTPRNQLFNPDFKINQRGRASYDAVAANTYTVDRWRTYNGGVTVVPFDDGIKVSNSTRINGGIMQPLELQRYYSGQKFSVAAFLNEDAPEGWYLDLSLYSETGTLAGRVSTKDIITLKKGVNYAPSVLTVPTDGTYYFRVHICNITTTPSTISIRWVNLVEGEHPGHFEYPDPATELARCQRFAFRPTSTYYDVAFMHGASAALYFIIPTPSTMRTVPSLSYANSLKVYINGGIQPSSYSYTFSVNNSDLRSAVVICAKSSTSSYDASNAILNFDAVLDSEL